MGRALPPWPGGAGLLTTHGDRVPGTLVGGDGHALRFRPALDGTPREWAVPFASVAAVWPAAPPADTPADPARYAWRGVERRDVLLFRNGDVLRGTLEALTDDVEVRFRPVPPADARAIPLKALSAIAFNPALARTRKPKGPYARVVLRNGTRLLGTGVTVESATARGRTLFGTPFEIPLGEVVGLDVLQGKAAFLADLAPVKVERTDFLGVAWPPAPTARSAAARCGWRRPTGTRRSTAASAAGRGRALTYALAGKYRRFDAVVGLDASVRTGSAAAKVLADGKERLDAGLLTPGMSREISVDVAGTKEMTLAVDFGPSGGVGADVSWGDARLVE